MPLRHSNNDKRRLIRDPEHDHVAALLESVVYRGSSKHKLNPRLYDLEPFRGQRGDATLAINTQISDLKTWALSMM